jgi:pimeloyl-ACP methyl ester carboxylesterase
MVLIPGIQGRWEWMEAALDALAGRGRALGFSLADEPSGGWACDDARGFGNYLRQVEETLDRCGIERAVVVGVSYGGLIAAEFAATRPARVAGVALVSALPIDWVPDRRARMYLAAPWLLSPVFAISAPVRLYPEIRAALPAAGPRFRFVARAAAKVVTAPASPRRMARRLRWALAHDFAGLDRIAAPALVVTGEAGLDRVVPTRETGRYAALRSVRQETLARTGHIGLVTRPAAFAELIGGFAKEVTGA